mmetsp:Transcript_13825/g.31902  ORF Transcript_13825/g.31902 Transcript_13825/m.31902 type:complete len:177 (+) Transcript_13825:219-749(+)
MTNRTQAIHSTLIQPVSRKLFDDFFANGAPLYTRAASCERKVPCVLNTAEIWRCASADHRLLHVLQILNSYDSRASSCNDDNDADAARPGLSEIKEVARSSTSFSLRTEHVKIACHRRASTTAIEHEQLCFNKRTRSGRSGGGSIPSIFTDELELMKIFHDAQRGGHIVQTDSLVC